MSLGTAVSVNKLRVFNRALEPQEIEEYVENGLSDVTTLVGEDERVSTEYFTTQGLKIDEPVEKGITIVRKRLSDGTVITNKIVR